MIFIFNDAETNGKRDHFVLLFQGTKEQAESYIGQFPAKYPHSYSVHAVPPNDRQVFARHQQDNSMPEVGDVAEEKDEDDLCDVDITPTQ